MKFVGVTLLVAFSGQFIFAESQGTPVTFEDVTQYFLLGFNLLRTARMDNQPSVVYASTWMQARAEAALRAKFRDKSKCEESAEDLTPASMGGFYEAATSFQKTESWGTRVVQDYEHHGLEVLKEKLTANAGFNPAVAPFSQTSVQNLAYMMYPQSHEVGCAMTTNCDNERVYILCLFTPPLVEGQAVPFPPLIFHSMLARASIPVYLSRLNSTDVQTLLTPMKFGEKDPSGAAGAASYALPGAGLLVFTVLGMLAF